MVVLAPHREVAKAFHVVRFAPQKLLVSVDAVFGVELLTKTLAGKHIPTVLPKGHQVLSVVRSKVVLFMFRKGFFKISFY